MKRTLASLTIVASLVVGALALGFDPITLKRTATVGQTTEYKLEGKLSFGGTDGSISGKVKYVVKSVDADGTVTTESTTSAMKFNDQEIPDVPDAVKMVEKADGEVVSLTTPNEFGPGIRYTNLVHFYFPSQPINVGDTWTVKVAADPKTGAVPVTAEMKFVGEEKIDTYDTVKVEGTNKETEGTEPGSVHGFYWINKVDGTMVKEELDITNANMGQASTSGKTSLIRTG